MAYIPLINILVALTTLMLIAGMIKPWWVLWFMYKQNRAMVLKYYGITLVILIIARYVLKSGLLTLG